MRILTIENLYPPHAFGGYEDLCAGAVQHWRDGGHDVEVLCAGWRRGDVPFDAPPPHGETVRRTLPMYWDDHRLVDPGWRPSMAMARDTRQQLEVVLDTVRPDVVSVWNAAGLSFALFDVLAARRVPTVLVVLDRWLGFGLALDRWHGRFARGPARVLGPVTATATRTPTRVRGLGDPVVACFGSHHLRDHGLQSSPWPFDDHAVVAHGRDATRYPVAAVADARGRPWRGRLLFVGRLAPTKGVETAIAAMAELPDATLDVHGGGETTYTAHLRRVVDDLGLGGRVVLHGEAGPDRLREAYLDADALVFPSEWREPFGVVPLEAMAHGLPVVATGTGGSGEFLVDERTALRFPPGDVHGLVRVVRRLAADPDLRARLGAVGPEVASWLDRSRANDDLLAWHAFAAGGLRGPRPDERPLLPPHLRGVADPGG